MDSIAKRFDVGAAYLYSINAVRRKDVLVYIGDPINLDPSTIISVGDENGTVYHVDGLPDPHLPQH